MEVPSQLNFMKDYNIKCYLKFINIFAIYHDKMEIEENNSIAYKQWLQRSNLSMKKDLNHEMKEYYTNTFSLQIINIIKGILEQINQYSPSS